MVRELQRSILERAGYRVSTAGDGQEAPRRCSSVARPDLVLTDVEMPRLDGLDLLARVRRLGRLLGLPVVLVTSRGAPGHRLAGADRYLDKAALDETLLLGTVADLLGAGVPA